MTDEDSENLPAVVDETDNVVEKMKETLREIDGPMSASNATVPKKAVDIGDVDDDPNPQSHALGYKDGQLNTADLNGDEISMVGGVMDLITDERSITVDEGLFIENVEEWA
jgi:hypothetical protein